MHSFASTGTMLQSVSISEFPEGSLMAHACAKLGLFKSVSEARKNGWNKPLAVGEYKVGKRQFRVME